MGYEWNPVVRTVPSNGSEESFDLRSLFADTDGPSRIEVSYDDLSSTKLDVNNHAHRIEFGIRPRVVMFFDVLTMADQITVSKIANRLMRSDWRVYLSLDGGIVEREVMMLSPPSPLPIRGKTFAGASFALAMQCIEPIESLPESMITDPSNGMKQFVLNGTFDAWITSTNAAHWSEVLDTPPQGTIEQDATEKYSGAYSCKMTRSASDSVNLYVINQSINLVPGQRCRMSFAYQGDANTDLWWYFKNNTQSVYLQPSGAWSATTWRYAYPTAAWQLYEQEFDVPESFGANDIYWWLAVHHDTADTGKVIRIDEVSIVGPILPDGGATW